MKIKKLTTLLLLCVIVLASCAPSADTSGDISADASSGDTSYIKSDIDIASDACVTDEAGENGVLIDYKDVSSQPDDFGCILMQPTTEAPFEMAGEVYAVAVKRKAKGGFEVMECDAKKISTKYFTLIFKGEQNIAFAKNYLTLGKVCMMYNTDKVTQFGDRLGMVVGKNEYFVDAVNPEKATGGITIYDEKYGFGVSPEYDGDFVDMLVFDGYVLEKCAKNETTVLPFPNGCLVRFAGDAVKKADEINVGDKIEAVGFEIECSPKAYVLINGCKVEIAYHNEYRNAVAYAVLYDSDFEYDSTETNIWGAEVAVDKDGFITKVVQGNTEGVSGNTAIPEGGFVLSSGFNAYSTYMTMAKVGDKAEYIEKDGAYDYRRIYDVRFDTYGEANEEYISVISRKVSNRTRQVNNGIYYAIDKDGFVTKVSDQPVDIPEDGCAIVATGLKRNEIKRFCKLGDRIINFELIGSIYIFRTATVDSLTKVLSELKNETETAKAEFRYLDFEAIDTAASTIEAYLADGKAKVVDAAKAIEGLKNMLMPSYTVGERAAWVIDTDKDLADIKHTVQYAKKLKIDTLIVCPFRDNYALYDTKVEHTYRSKDMPELDILQAYIDECHANDIKVIFMLCCFDSDKPSDKYEPDHYVNYFADKLLISKKGRDAAYFYDAASYSLNPHDPEVRAFYKAIVKDVLDNYDVDGIQLDAIRFPLPSFYDVDKYEDQGYNDDIIADFQKKYRTKRDPRDFSITEPIWEDWCEFRRDIITSFVGEVSRLCSEVEFSCTCFPAYKDRQYYVFQDAEKWGQLGYVDAIYTMSYTASAETFVEYATKLVEGVGDSCRVILGIGTYDGETNEVLKKQLCHAYSSGCDGISIFALQYIQSCHFDEFYYNAFRDPSVRTADIENALKAYAELLLSKCEKVYEYIYPDAELDEVKAQLETIENEVTASNAKKQFNKALSLMKDSNASDEVKADFETEISNILTIIERAK